MKQKTPFRRLLELFQARFFENDEINPEGGFETNIWQILGLLVAPGFFVMYLGMPQLLEMATKHLTVREYWILKMFRLFFPAFSFSVVGYASFFQWEKLFPDRRDFLILGSFPVRARTVLAAKVSALCLFLLMLIAAINFFPNVLGPILSFAIPEVRGAGYFRLVGAQFGSSAAASLFAFLMVAAFQGLLINVTSARVFRRISPWIQMAGMSLMILSLLMFPVCCVLLPSAAAKHSLWLWFYPPVWFTGLYDLLLQPSDRFFASLGRFGGAAMAIAVAAFCVTWGLGFRRHYLRTLESEDTDSHVPRAGLPDWLPATTEERAIYRFTGNILRRSAAHRLFLASYLSVGVAIGVLTAVRFGGDRLSLFQDGLRSFPLLVAFFVVSGFRAAFQFPAELSANWLFRMTEDGWAEKARRASRRRVLASGLLPILMAFLPVAIWKWGGATAMFHMLFQLATGAMLVEVLFWSFDKVPFTCSYFPGKMNLALLFGIYLYGFTEYSFRMADLEASLEGRMLWSLAFFAVASGVLAFSWRRRPKAAEVRFDGNDPYIQGLNLT